MLHRCLVRLLPGVLLAACAGPPGDPPPGEKKQGMTWHRDVLPIVQKHCQGCHTAGGIAPFALTSYAEAQPLHAAMAGAVKARRMPPWMPADTCQSFRDARRLTQDQIDTIAAWSQDGAPEGSPADAPPRPQAPPGLAWVDATLDAGADYSPPGRLTTDYHCFLLDPRLAEGRELIGFEVVPGARAQVHHVLLYPADGAEARAADARAAGTGWPCFGGTGVTRTQTIGGWVPGTPPMRYPEGTAVYLEAGRVLVMQIHYDNHGGGPPRPDRTMVKLQYARQPGARRAQIFGLPNATFVIPPGATGHQDEARFVVPADVTLYGLQPHAHQLGRKLRVATPETCLISGAAR
jgi:hypothetical protein